MVMSVPELKAAQLDQYNRTVDRLAEAEAQRTGRNADDLEIRVFLGALAGALIAALEGDLTGIMDRTRQALDFMEAGMRFT